MTRGPVIALAAAEIVSLAGTRLSMIAIPWLVLTTTGDPLLTGVVGFAEMLPYAVAKALGGPLIDRLGARRIAVTADLMSMAVLALVPLLSAFGLLHFWALLPIVALLGALRGPADAAKQSMVPAVAALAGLPLERVTGIVGIIERLASAIGAAAAGGLVAAIGPAPALTVNIAACGVAALIVAFGLRMIRANAIDATATGPGYFADLREGWRYFRGDAVLVGLVIMIALTNMLDQASGGVLLPVWSSIAGDAALLGLLFATLSGASVLGSIIATLLAERLPRLAVYTIAFLICGAPRYFIFAIEAPLPAILTTVAIAGFASGFLNPIIGAVMFERIPPALTGRVSALVNALSWTLIPVGGLLGGALVSAFGLSAAFIICGVAYFGATMLPLALPGFRIMAHRPAPAE